jgi:ribose transport system permease protein
MNLRKINLKRAFEPQFVLIWILLAIVSFFAISSSAFRSPQNLLEIVRSASINAVLVLGLTWIVAMGEIDVTFPDIAALSSVVCALSVSSGLPWGISIFLALLAGSLYGLLSGILINVFKFRALIATIGVTTLVKATAYILGKGGPIYLNRIDFSIQFLVYGKIAGIPVLFLIILILYILASFLQNQTKLGQYLYAIGENRQAALEAGIPEKKITYSFFILSALLASAGGILLLVSFTSGQPNFQGTYFIDGLTAVFLGALVIKAGKPNVIGTFIGAILIMVLGNGMTLLGVPFYIGLITKGILMMAGVLVIAFTRSRALRLKRTSRISIATSTN